MTTAVRILLAAFLFSGCVTQIAVNSIGTIMENGFAVLNEEQDLDIAATSIASSLKLLEAVIRTDPGNEKFLTMASEGYASYALGFVEDDSVGRARTLYLRAKEFGLRALNLRSPISASAPPEEFQRSLAGFSRRDVPALFWTAIGWGSYIGWSLTDPAALADLPKVEAMMRSVAEHDSAYYYGGPLFFLGTLYGSRPAMLGGDSSASRAWFERCLRINRGRFLMTYVYYARSYAVQTQDQGLFERCLAAVDSASIEALPEARLPNAIAKKKARLLRARSGEFF